MRRLLSVIVVAATTVLVPMFAMAGNQEVADQIAKNLKQSGKLSDYRIAVKFQDGTATLKGRVVSQEQMNTALKLVFKTPGVSRVVNQLAIGGSETTAAVAKNNSSPLAQRVASSYAPCRCSRSRPWSPARFRNSVWRIMHPVRSAVKGRCRLSMTQAMPAQDGGVPGAPRPMYSAAPRAEWLRFVMISRACRTMLGQVTRLIQTTQQ